MKARSQKTTLVHTIGDWPTARHLCDLLEVRRTDRIRLVLDTVDTPAAVAALVEDPDPTLSSAEEQATEAVAAALLRLYLGDHVGVFGVTAGTVTLGTVACDRIRADEGSRALEAAGFRLVRISDLLAERRRPGPEQPSAERARAHLRGPQLDYVLRGGASPREPGEISALLAALNPAVEAWNPLDHRVMDLLVRHPSCETLALADGAPPEAGIDRFGLYGDELARRGVPGGAFLRACASDLPSARCYRLGRLRGLEQALAELTPGDRIRCAERVIGDACDLFPDQVALLERAVDAARENLSPSFVAELVRHHGVRDAAARYAEGRDTADRIVVWAELGDPRAAAEARRLATEVQEPGRAASVAAIRAVRAAEGRDGAWRLLHEAAPRWSASAIQGCLEALGRPGAEGQAMVDWLATDAPRPVQDNVGRWARKYKVTLRTGKRAPRPVKTRLPSPKRPLRSAAPFASVGLAPGAPEALPEAWLGPARERRREGWRLVAAIAPGDLSPIGRGFAVSVWEELPYSAVRVDPAPLGCDGSFLLVPDERERYHRIEARATEPDAPGTRSGGVPSFIQSPEVPPPCAGCGADLEFALQLDTDVFGELFGDAGALYVFLCPRGCGGVGFNQCH